MKCKYWNENIERVKLLVEVLYDDLGECTGGLLHIVLDDGNLEDEHILWCMANCNSRENSDRHDRFLCERIGNELLNLNMEERRLVYQSSCAWNCKGECDSCPIVTGYVW